MWSDSSMCMCNHRTMHKLKRSRTLQVTQSYIRIQIKLKNEQKDEEKKNARGYCRRRKTTPTKRKI